MFITVRNGNKEVRVIVEEKIDLNDVTVMLRLLSNRISFGVTLDMSKVKEVDEKVIKLVMAANRAVKKDSGRLSLIAPPQEIVEVLSRSDFDGEISWPESHQLNF